MRHLILPFILLVISYNAMGQSRHLYWKKVPEIADTVYSIRVINNQIYAGTTSHLFVSDTSGTDWQAVLINPKPSGIDQIMSFENRLYLSAYRVGVMVSEDDGLTWDLMAASPSRFPVAFAERGGQLFVATNDHGVFQLDETGTQWIEFNDGLSAGTGHVFDCLINSDGTLFGGVSANGAVGVRGPDDGAWQLSYPTGGIAAGMVTFDVKQAGKYTWAFTSRKVFATDDQGGTWHAVENGIRQGYQCRGLQVGDSLYTSVNFAGNNTIIYRRGLNESLESPWTPVDTLLGQACFGLAFLHGKLYVATQTGIFYTPVKGNLIEPKPQPEKFRVFPNPANEVITILNGLENNGQAFRILNIWGKELLYEKVITNQQTVSISKLLPGIHFYRLERKEQNPILGPIIILR